MNAQPEPMAAISRPMARSKTVVLSIVLASTCACAIAQTPAAGSLLTPPSSRITDDAIQSDHQTYDRMQARIKALNDGGRRVADYHLSKAQCWLDVSFHEYTRNDRSAFPQEALDEAGKLVDAMERKVAPLPMTTPLVNGAARLRPDLWAATASLEQNAGFRCVQQAVACAEVELVHAGNEYNQQQWRHAAPYIQIAEDLVADASTRAASCPGTGIAAVPATVMPLPAPTSAPAPMAAMPSSYRVLFAFNRSAIADIDPAGRAQLQSLADRYTRDRASIGSIRLVGYADPLNHSTHRDYNLRLSERRVQAVRDWLVRKGFDTALIETTARGDADPVVRCGDAAQPEAKLESCLRPDRRVEITVLPPITR